MMVTEKGSPAKYDDWFGVMTTRIAELIISLDAASDEADVLASMWVDALMLDEPMGFGAGNYR